VSIVGIGQDLIELDRIRQAVQAHGDRFLRRCFTFGEIAYCSRFKDPTPELAVRFAAKEAASKALGTGIAQGVAWRDMEILRQAGEPPMLTFHGQARRRATRLRVGRAHVTLTHAQAIASAVVILEKKKSDLR
jgi:holo-[acyl-carrier protein] synthase